MIRVLLAEDQALILGALSALLELDGRFKVVGKCTNGQHAIDTLQLLHSPPELVLTDIEMPIVNGIELTEQIKEQWPQTKTIIMTTFARPGYIRRAMEVGAKGFILKEQPSDYLVDSMLKVMGGQRVIDPELALMALDDSDPLSDKERAALKLAGEGVNSQEIAKRLFLSQGTVRNYLSEAIAKLNATNRVDAARIARQKGWL